MQHDEFDRIFEDTVEKSRSVLASKSKEYATEDKLHNFKVAAVTEGVSNRQALGGMMVKHTVSIYDMLRADECADLSMWDEKIGDHINYLILLRALVIEELGDVVFETVADALAESIKHLPNKVVLKTDFDPPSMPTIPDENPLKPNDELHTTYKCESCACEVVNVTKSGTLYDRITCRNCANTFGRIRYMYPIIDNPRSGIKNVITTQDTPVDVKPKAPEVSISYHCFTCGQTSIEKYENDGAIPIVDAIPCRIGLCEGTAIPIHWSVVWGD